MTTSPRSLACSTRYVWLEGTPPTPLGKTTTGSSTVPKLNLRTTSRPVERCAVVVLHTDEFGVYQPEVVWWDDAWREVEWE